MYPVVFLLCLLMTLTEASALTIDRYNGKLGVEVSMYSRDGAFPNQAYKSNLSVFFQSEFLWRSNQGASSLYFVPYLRIDQRDHSKSHLDIREFIWKYSQRDWHFNIGIGKVFWGVTEFNHLVDVINQTDLVESIDGEEKLGQPMFNISVIRDWGALDLFILPGFRERTFAGTEGRLRAPVAVDTETVLYDSLDGDQHIDFAVRWSDTFRYFDAGAYFFDGTNREPLFEIQPKTELVKSADFVAIANYQQMKQFGIDLQATVSSWLYKFEGLWRQTTQTQFLASQLGVEYAFYNLAGRDLEIGLLVEYGWDERGVKSSSIFQNDLFVGGRVSFNDLDNKELLFGLAYDRDYFSNSAFFEYSQRLYSDGKLSLEGRLFNAESAQDPLNTLTDDDYIQLTFEYFF